MASPQTHLSAALTRHHPTGSPDCPKPVDALALLEMRLGGVPAVRRRGRLGVPANVAPFAGLMRSPELGRAGGATRRRDRIRGPPSGSATLLSVDGCGFASGSAG